ncbi:PaaI family thioesterase [Caproicibacter sp. BJN0012]|uniref:PaaI family thioesterase n=1 Tax=Caproicibacter sp. BJN0012 TaxID=3110227 RepID=UPI002E0DB108
MMAFDRTNGGKPWTKESWDRYLHQKFNTEENYPLLSDINLTRLGDGMAEGEILLSHKNRNLHGFCHGGALSTLVDVISAFSCFSRGLDVTTATMNLQFFRPAGGDRLICTATPEKVGKTLCNVRAVIRDESDTVVTVASVLLYVLDRIEITPA